MKKFQGKYRIESNRLRGWDYSSPGSYFITICITNMEYLLGTVKSGTMILSEYGKIVESECKKIPEYHPRAMLDVWVVMLNHIHCIITLGDYDFHNGIAVGHGDDGGGRDNGDVSGNGVVDKIHYGHVDKIHEFYLSNRNEFYVPPIYPMSESSGYTIYEIKQYRKQRRKMVIPKLLGTFQMQTSKQINIIRSTLGRKNWQADYYSFIIFPLFVFPFI